MKRSKCCGAAIVIEQNEYYCDECDLPLLEPDEIIEDEES